MLYVLGVSGRWWWRLIFGRLLDKAFLKVFNVDIGEFEEEGLDVVLNDPVHVGDGLWGYFHDVGPFHVESDGKGECPEVGEVVFFVGIFLEFFERALLDFGQVETVQLADRELPAVVFVGLRMGDAHPDPGKGDIAVEGVVVGLRFGQPDKTF
jgi:hypothetical protein